MILGRADSVALVPRQMHAIVGGRVLGRAAPATVGAMSTIDALLMSPGAIAAELARINVYMSEFHNELLAAAQHHGLVDPTITVAGITDWISDAIAAMTPGGAAITMVQQAATAAAQAQSQGSGPDGVSHDVQVIRTVLDAAHARTIPNDPVVHLFIDGWMPIWNAWRKFYGEEKDGSWWHNAGYDAEKYLAQLMQMRAQAKALGIKLVSPDPTGEHTDNGLPTWALAALGGLGLVAVIAIAGAFRGNG
jgi:hypothetical protein